MTQITEETFEQIQRTFRGSPIIDLRDVTFIDPYGMVGLLEIGEFSKSGVMQKLLFLPKSEEVHLQLDQPRYRQQFLAELTPESAVVEAWASRVGAAEDRERSAVLDYGSDDAGFESLVRSTIATRGITTQSIIQRLVDTNSVEQNRENRTLRLLVDHYSPYLSQDEPNIVNAAFYAISNLISTIEHNVAAAQDAKLYQRQRWTFRLDPGDQERFRQATRGLLERFEREAEGAIKPWEQQHYDSGLVTAGVGLYYFEDTGSNNAGVAVRRSVGAASAAIALHQGT